MGWRYGDGDGGMVMVVEVWWWRYGDGVEVW